MNVFKDYVTWAVENPGKSFVIGSIGFAVAWWAAPIAASSAAYVWLSEEALKTLLIAAGGAATFTNLVPSAFGVLDNLIAAPLRAQNQALRNELHALQNEVQRNGQAMGQGFQQIAIDIVALRRALTQRANALRDTQALQQQRVTALENGLNERVENLIGMITIINTENYSARIQNLENKADSLNNPNNKIVEINEKLAAIDTQTKAIQALAQEKQALQNTITEIQVQQEQDRVLMTDLNNRLNTVTQEDQAQAQLIDDLAPTLARLQQNQEENTEKFVAINNRLTAVEAQSETLTQQRNELNVALSSLEQELQQHTQNTQASYQHIHTLLAQQPVPVASPTVDLRSEEEPPPVVNDHHVEQNDDPLSAEAYIIDNYGDSEDYEIGDDALNAQEQAAEVESRVTARAKAMQQSSSISSYTSS